MDLGKITIPLYVRAVRSVVSDSLRPYGLRPTRAAQSTRFSRHEYWRGLPVPPPGDLPGPGTEPLSSVAPASQADSLLRSHQGKLGSDMIAVLPETEPKQREVK